MHSRAAGTTLHSPPPLGDGAPPQPPPSLLLRVDAAGPTRSLSHLRRWLGPREWVDHGRKAEGEERWRLQCRLLLPCRPHAPPPRTAPPSFTRRCCALRPLCVFFFASNGGSGSVPAWRTELFLMMARDLDERGVAFLKGHKTLQSLTLSDLFYTTDDGAFVLRLRAADPPERANVLYLDPKFAAVISKAVKDVFHPCFDQDKKNRQSAPETEDIRLQPGFL